MNYELLDFGHGRKLERFGECIVDRPSPAAQGFVPKWPDRWEEAGLRYDEVVSKWIGSSPSEWLVRFGRATFQLKPTPFGHLGLFPEQRTHWEWMSELHAHSKANFKSLNLFAYTGGTTQVLAALGSQVTHVDASRPAVQWARSNALVAGLEEAPIRWVVEDAKAYVAREIRRGNRYDFIALDPPTYGHGPRGERWQWDRDIRPLLVGCFELLSEDGIGILLTGHTDDSNPSKWLIESAHDAEQDFRGFQITDGRSTLSTSDEEQLDFGFWVRCMRKA